MPSLALFPFFLTVFRHFIAASTAYSHFSKQLNYAFFSPLPNVCECLNLIGRLTYLSHKGVPCCCGFCLRSSFLSDSRRSDEGLDLCRACEALTGVGFIDGAQIISGLWRIYPLFAAARRQLVIEGINFRGQAVTALEKEKLCANGPTLKINIRKHFDISGELGNRERAEVVWCVP